MGLGGLSVVTEQKTTNLTATSYPFLNGRSSFLSNSTAILNSQFPYGLMCSYRAGVHVPEVLLMNGVAFLFELFDDCLQVDGRPEHNGIGDKIKTAHLVDL